MEKEQLNVTFKELDDVEKTLDTLFHTIEWLLLYYKKFGAEILYNFLIQISMYVWGIYFGTLGKNK
jgi:hypothetical protein